MFFPTTAGDTIELDPHSFDKEPGFSNTKQYLDKPTIIMCNPNALVYQWMITATNAYWLDFFLRRECNVFIWNYRGYGRSQQSIFTPYLTPD